MGFAWTSLLAFIRLSTKVGLYPAPLPVAQAAGIVRAWLAQAPAVILEPSPRHLEVLTGLLTTTGTGGNLTTDAHLAALGLEHDATVITYDRDFDRFPGVRWEPPA